MTEDVVCQSGAELSAFWELSLLVLKAATVNKMNLCVAGELKGSLNVHQKRLVPSL